MRVLVACEFSGVVRRAFVARGHAVTSVDLLPAEDGANYVDTGSKLGFHYQGDIFKFLAWRGAKEFDLMIAHPPCTYLARAGARWWPERMNEQREALDFVRRLLAVSIPRIALENPPGAIGTRIRPADQYVQPWQHSHPETKMTGLWLKDLPLLRPTKDVHAQMLALPTKQRNKVHYAAPGPNRWKERSRTYQGIADAMAAQWGGLAGEAAA